MPAITIDSGIQPTVPIQWAITFGGGPAGSAGSIQFNSLTGILVLDGGGAPAPTIPVPATVNLVSGDTPAQVAAKLAAAWDGIDNGAGVSVNVSSAGLTTTVTLVGGTMNLAVPGVMALTINGTADSPAPPSPPPGGGGAAPGGSTGEFVENVDPLDLTYVMGATVRFRDDEPMPKGEDYEPLKPSWKNGPIPIVYMPRS